MDNYTQLCVWPGTVVGEENSKAFEDFFMEEMNVRVKYHTEVTTLPDLDCDSRPLPGTGGRNDAFFYVHSEDVSKFAIPRLALGIRWWEDVVGYNKGSHLYTETFLADHPLRW